MIFLSAAWMAEAVALVNRQSDLAQALSGLGQDLAAVVEADPPLFTRVFAAYGRQEGGRVVGVRVLPDPEEIWELEPAYVVRAPYREWKALLLGADPVQAALSGRVRVEGDLAGLLRRSGFLYLARTVLAELVTEFEEGSSGQPSPPSSRRGGPR